METCYDVLILGGGPAGYTAALYAARAGMQTLVVEKAFAGGQMALTDEIDNYPGFPRGIDGLTLGMNMEKGAQRFGAETKFGEVTSVELSGKVKRVFLGKDSFLGKTVIVCTGAEPRELGLENERELTGRGIHYCAHCDGRFYKGKTVAVVGGGNSAAADALSLARMAKKVCVIHRRDALRATKVYHEPLMKAENVEFFWNSTVSQVLWDGRVTGVGLRDVKSGKESTVACDGVFISIGRKPETAFLGGALKLDEGGYLVADESTKTSIPGVFAAGDVRTKALRQIVTAMSDGATAAHFAEEYLSGEPSFS